MGKKYKGTIYDIGLLMSTDLLTVTCDCKIMVTVSGESASLSDVDDYTLCVFLAQTE